MEIHLFAAARAAVGQGTVRLAPASLGALMDELCAAYPDFGPVRARCSYLLDEVAVHDEDVEVGAGSRVDVLPPFAGG